MMSAAPDTQRIRLFIGIELPDPWRDALSACQARQERLAPGYFRWVRPELLHLTLAFLGQQPADQLPVVAAALAAAAAGQGSFELSLAAPGTFGSPQTPRVLWVGVADNSQGLPRLRQALEGELRQAQLTFDDKPLVPHITLARARERRPSRHTSAPISLPRSLPSVPAYWVDELTLFESQLQQAGPVYLIQGRGSLGRSGD